jgi:adenylate cyclase
VYTGTSSGPLPSRNPIQQRSFAVLPFADMSAARDQEFFADGLTEELLNVLAQLPELRVASRTSSFSYRAAQVPIDSIARALRVAHVLEGSVRRDGDLLRITAQLIDAGRM